MKCRFEPKDNWCMEKCFHANEHEETFSCTWGRCPLTHKFLDCGAWEEPEPTVTLAEAVEMVTENVAVAMRRGDDGGTT